LRAALRRRPRRAPTPRVAPVAIGVTWRVRSRPLSDRAVRAAVRAALAHGGWQGERVDVVLVSDSALARLHGRHLADPSPTDVIAFDLSDPHGGVSAEIYASVERARMVARERGVAAGRELALYLVHGALHLSGFDDRRTAARRAMRAAERAVLDALGYPADPSPHP